MEESHLHWEFLAYNGEADAQQLPWPISIRVTGYSTEENARIAAQAIVTRDNCRLRSVYECSQCGFQRAVTDSFNDMIKAIK